MRSSSQYIKHGLPAFHVAVPQEEPQALHQDAAELGNAYTGHDSKNAGIQRHSMADHFANFQIIMAYAPKLGLWEAQRRGVVLAFGRDYAITLGRAQILATASPAMNGHIH